MSPRRIFRFLFDTAAVAVQGVLFELFRTHWDSIAVHLVAPVYLFYGIGLLWKRDDPDYMNGLRWFGSRCMPCLILFVILQSVLGALAVGAFSVTVSELFPPAFETYFLIVSLVFMFPLSLSTMIYLVLGSRRDDTGAHRFDAGVHGQRMRLFAADFAVWCLGCIMLSFLYSMADQASIPAESPGLRLFLSLLFTFLMGLMFYFPSRFHLILEAPRDASNWISAILSLAALSAYLLTRTGV